MESISFLRVSPIIELSCVNYNYYCRYSASRTANFGIPTAPAATSSHAIYDAPKPTHYMPPTIPSSSTSQHIYDPYAPRRPAPSVSAPVQNVPKPGSSYYLWYFWMMRSYHYTPSDPFQRLALLFDRPSYNKRRRVPRFVV